MTSLRPPVPGALRPYVAACYSYHQEGVREYAHVGLPSPSLVLVVDLADGLRLSGLGRERAERFAAGAAGMHTEAVRIHEGGTSHGVMVHLTPLGARSLLGLPAAALSHQIVELEDLVGARARGLRDRMHDAGDWGCVAVLHDWLLQRVRDRRHESVGLEAWDCIAAGAAHRVAALARETGWSERHLHQEVCKEIGVPPRTLLSLMRFDSTVPDVRAGHRLAEVAAAHGYADQAHLAREWRRFTGFSPTGWRANEGLTQQPVTRVE